MKRGFEGSLDVRLVYILFALSAFFLFSGCATYKDESAHFSRNWDLGKVYKAASIAAYEAKSNEKGPNALIWKLEEGAACRAANQLQESILAFDRAEESVRVFESQPSFSILAETKALVTNLSQLPYKGYAYDKIMLNTYQALNYMQAAEFDKARVELNRALQSQRNALDENAKAIEKVKQEAEGKYQKDPSATYNVEKALSDRKLNQQLHERYGYLNDYELYANYVNPFTVYLDGLFFMAQATGGSDLERALKSFQRAYSMVPQNNYIQQDIDFIYKLFSGASFRPTTYVIFETGRAPARESIRIDIPLFLVNREVPYIGVAFPQLRFNSDYVNRLTVIVQNESYQTTTIANMDAIIAQEFKNSLPLVIVKTLWSAGTKALMQYGIKEGTKDIIFLNIIAQLGGVFYEIAFNEADLRTWLALPKEFQIARFSTPQDRKITLSTGLPSQNVDILIKEGMLNLIFVKSNSSQSGLIVNQVILK